MSGAFRKIIRYTVSAACCGLTVFLGYYVQRTEFAVLLAAYSLFFGLYLAVAFWQKKLTDGEIKWFTALGIGLRFLLLFNLPNFSDDFYRFVWDGHLTVAGIHPFAHPPAWFMSQPVQVPGITTTLFAQLNSPDYFTVYPPMCQAIFALAVWVAPASLWGQVVVMKLFLFAGELGTLWLLGRFDSGQKNKQLRYALNPLILFEIVGNCHFEGLMIFFLLAGWQMLQRIRLPAAAGLWGLATATKLLPPLFLPLVWRWLGQRRGWQFQLLFAGACGLLFLPLLDSQVLLNLLNSLDLYFRRFEFNASLYYLARALGQWWTGFYQVEIIGPALGLVTLVGTLWLTRQTQKAGHPPSGRLSLPEAMLWAVFLYLSCATTVHPWYATVPLVLCLLTDWRFPILWSGLIMLSYSHYTGGGSAEKFWLIGLEYGLLWLFIIREILMRKRSFPAEKA